MLAKANQWAKYGVRLNTHIGKDMMHCCSAMESDTKIYYRLAENEQKARKADIKYMKEFFPDTVFGKYPNLGHPGLVLLKPELFAGKIRRL